MSDRSDPPGRHPPGRHPPDRRDLHDAALRHLARYAASVAGLIRVLDRRIARWAREADGDGVAEQVAAARGTVREVVGALVRDGLLDDAAFAASRAKGLTRLGRSRRAVAAHLSARGVDPALAPAAEDPDAELAGALVCARRRKLGAFRPAEHPEDRSRELGILARAGFPEAVARRALGVERDIAEAMIIALRRS